MKTFLTHTYTHTYQSLCIELCEGSLHHVFHTQVVHSDQVKDHIVAQAELRTQIGRLSPQQRLDLLRFGQLIPGSDNHSTHLVQTSSSRAASLLTLIVEDNNERSLTLHKVQQSLHYI